MALKDLLNKIMERANRREEQEPDIDDDETTDRHLRSLRRERRTQMEEGEKKELMKVIAEHKKDRMRRELFGIKDNIRERKAVIAKKKVGNILKAGQGMIAGHGSMLRGKGTKASPKKKGSTKFLNKHDL